MQVQSEPIVTNHDHIVEVFTVQVLHRDSGASYEMI